MTTNNTTSQQLVWCVEIVSPNGSERVHIFSTEEKRKQWVNAQPDYDGTLYVNYDYVIDDPDRMDKPLRKHQ